MHFRGSDGPTMTLSQALAPVFSVGFTSAASLHRVQQAQQNHDDMPALETPEIQPEPRPLFSAPTQTGGTFRQSRLPTARRPAAHPSFANKAVHTLRCASCHNFFTNRAMRAILLADTTIELFSTDAVPSSVQLVGNDYRAQGCECRIRDLACTGCGDVVGYHVVGACATCLGGCNNGHFWMLNQESIKCANRLSSDGGIVKWGDLPGPDFDDRGSDGEIEVCR